MSCGRALKAPVRSVAGGAAVKICTSSAPGEPLAAWWVSSLSTSLRARVGSGRVTTCGPRPRLNEPLATGVAASSSRIS